MKRKCSPLTSAVLGCALASTVPAGALGDPLAEGVSAYQKGQYRQAFELIRESAEEGRADAQHLLGAMYRQGLGVEVDEYEAFYWCNRAAEKGLLEAQFQVGLMYLDGDGVTADDGKALEWLWIAAERGYPQANEVVQYLLTGEPVAEYQYGC